MKLAAPFSNQTRVAALKQSIMEFRDEVQKTKAIRA
jgi:hypothetical protein